MNQAHSAYIEINELKKQIPNLDENKFKSLEARFTGKTIHLRKVLLPMVLYLKTFQWRLILNAAVPFSIRIK